MEFTFQPAFCLQSLPRKAYKAGHSAGMGRSFPIGVPRKAHPRLQPQNGMQLPQRRPSGKCIPESVSRMGRSFRMSPHAESLSRNEPSERDTLSETRPIGKLYPGLSGDSGTQFPADAETESPSRYRWGLRTISWTAKSRPSPATTGSRPASRHRAHRLPARS